MRHIGALLAGLLLALAFAGAAEAKSYALPRADVAVELEADGSLGVQEAISFAFSGPFSGAYRDIPLREGESADRVSVAEGRTLYRPGGCTELGCDDAPGTYGLEQTSNRLRIVWHYRAADEPRTFTIRYRLRGVAVAYDDVVDVNLQVWGGHWPVGVGYLTATETAPGRVLRAWGHPAWVRGDVQLAGQRALLRAVDVPAKQFVELRTLVPRSAFASTSGMRVRSGNGLERIVAEEADATAAAGRDRERIDEAKAHPWRTAAILMALALLPALAVLAVVFWLYGREQRTGYDREYEQEPPTDTQPALVPVLLRQGGGVGSYEFTATLFDLIRRGRYHAVPVTTERSLWMGLRKERVADLELSAGEDIATTDWENAVVDVVDGVLDGGKERLSRFRDEIEDDREAMSKRFTSFKEGVDADVDSRGWFQSIGIVPLGAAAALFVAVGALLIWRALDGWRTVYPRWSDVVLLALGDE